jgi:hypothetical protein
VKQCAQSCPKDDGNHGRNPPPPLDPGCGNRNITGTIHCTINQPPVNAHETIVSSVLFAPKDVVTVTADGCVQTGGHGNTWKRYVNPSGPNSASLYHGLIRIPTGTKGGALVRINTVIGRQLAVTGQGVPIDQLVLHLGYEDGNGDYGDNGYYSHDDGTEDQCKSSGSNDGGPAHVTITIFRGTTAQDPGSRFDFDVVSNSGLDLNGLPYNPVWSWQTRPGNQNLIPSTSICHEFSRRGSTLGFPDIFMSPYFGDCTDQADESSVDLPQGSNAVICNFGTSPYFGDTFAGHVNWFPVTMEGRVGWGDHGADDDYTFSYHSEGVAFPLSVNGRKDLHIEFDSDETIDHFSSKEWNQLHAAVDAWKVAEYLLSQCDAQHNCSDAQRAQYQQVINQVKVLFDGHTILTGMFGLDGEHGLKAELHPLYAMATRRDNFENDPSDEVWLMFVRNHGDEGFCSSSTWDSGFEDYTVKLPWRDGMTSVDVNWAKNDFVGTDGTSGPTVRITLPPSNDKGVYVSFHLGPPVHNGFVFEPGASVPFISGSLHLIWSGAQPLHPLTAGVTREIPEAAGASPQPVPIPPPHGFPGVEEDEAEDMLKAAIEKLPLAQQQQIQRSRLLSGTKPVVVHPLPKTGKVELMTQPPAVARKAPPHAINGGPAIHKAARDEAQVKALCAATNNAPSGLPADVCKTTLAKPPVRAGTEQPKSQP